MAADPADLKRKHEELERQIADEPDDLKKQELKKRKLLHLKEQIEGIAPP